MNIPQVLHDPPAAPLRTLVALTRHFYAMSALSDPRSNFHGWYYRLACECERRGYNLERVLRGKR
jgi:hypothetical protein